MPCLHKHTADHCIDAHLIRNTWPSLGSQPLSSHLHTRANPADPIPEKQVYTVWMKSLVFNGHGCTIYGQDGRVAYRVDNYACSRRREVYVMDSGGKTLLKKVSSTVNLCAAPSTRLAIPISDSLSNSETAALIAFGVL